MSLPKFKTDDEALSLLQTQWSSQINPVLNLPINNSIILSNVSLTAGSNTINHLLSRNLQGWIVIRQTGNANIWDNQNTNPIPDKTLILQSTSGISVDLMVF